MLPPIMVPFGPGGSPGCRGSVALLNIRNAAVVFAASVIRRRAELNRRCTLSTARTPATYIVPISVRMVRPMDCRFFMQPNMSDDPKQTLHCLLGSMPAADRSTKGVHGAG